MSFDPVLLDFARAIGAFLAAAFVLVWGSRRALSPKDPALAREIWLRYWAWVGIVAALLAILAAGRVAWILAVVVVALAALREYARAVGLAADRAFVGVVGGAIVVMGGLAWWPYPDASPEPGWYGLFIVMPIYGTLGILVIPVLGDRFAGMLRTVCLALLGLVYFGFCLLHLAYLINLPGGNGLVLFLSTCVALNDVSAFIVGKLLGRTKLRPRLSPGKTWEGALGALLVTVLAAVLLRWLVPAYSLGHVVAVSILLGVGGTLGDLSLSVVKRDLGIKDWGHALPGHGGVLDRTNSFLFATPIFFHYTRYFFT